MCAFVPIHPVRSMKRWLMMLNCMLHRMYVTAALRHMIELFHRWWYADKSADESCENSKDTLTFLLPMVCNVSNGIYRVFRNWTPPNTVSHFTSTQFGCDAFEFFAAANNGQIQLNNWLLNWMNKFSQYFGIKQNTISVRCRTCYVKIIQNDLRKWRYCSIFNLWDSWQHCMSFNWIIGGFAALNRPFPFI